jgi:hypothetical protein
MGFSRACACREALTCCYYISTTFPQGGSKKADQEDKTIMVKLAQPLRNTTQRNGNAPARHCVGGLRSRRLPEASQYRGMFDWGEFRRHKNRSCTATGKITKCQSRDFKNECTLTMPSRLAPKPARPRIQGCQYHGIFNTTKKPLTQISHRPAS